MAALTNAYQVSGGGVTFSGNVAASNNFDPFTNSAVVGDYFVIGSYSGFFEDAAFTIDTAFAATSKTFVWEYLDKNGTWQTVVSGSDGTNNLANSGTYTFTATSQTGWAIKQLNSVWAYWVRIRLSAVSGITEGGHCNAAVTVDQTMPSYYIRTLGIPQNPTATAIAGGSLAASTTYYYKIITLDQSSTSQNIQSLPSVEVSATTTVANKSISLTWDAVTGAGGYVVFRSLVSGNYNTDTQHQIVSGNGATTYCTTTTNSYTDAGAGLAKKPCTDMPCVYTWNGSASTPCAYEKVANWMVNEGYTDNVKANSTYEGGEGKAVCVHLRCMLKWGLDWGGTGDRNAYLYAVVAPGSVSVIEGRERVNSTADLLGTFNCGTEVVDANGGNYWKNGAVFIRKSLAYNGGNSWTYNPTLNIYDSAFFFTDAVIGNVTTVDDTFYLLPTRASNFTWNFISGAGGNSMLNGPLTYKYINATMPMRPEYSQYGTPTLIGTKSIGKSYCFLFYNNDAQTVTVSDPTFVSRGGLNYDISFHRGGTNLKTVYLDNPTFATASIVGKTGANPTYLTVIIRRLINCVARNKQGTAISGATVTLNNKNGTQIFSVTTAADGTITEQKIEECTLAGKAATVNTVGGDGVTYDKTDNNPFTLTVSKDGYKTMTQKVTVERNEYWEVQLEGCASVNQSKMVRIFQ